MLDLYYVKYGYYIAYIFLLLFSYLQLLQEDDSNEENNDPSTSMEEYEPPPKKEKVMKGNKRMSYYQSELLKMARCEYEQRMVNLRLKEQYYKMKLDRLQWVHVKLCYVRVDFIFFVIELLQYNCVSELYVNFSKFSTLKSGTLISIQTNQINWSLLKIHI